MNDVAQFSNIHLVKSKPFLDDFCLGGPRKQIAYSQRLFLALYFHIFFTPAALLLIHEAEPQSRPGVITISASGVCTSVRPNFSKSHKKHFQIRRVTVSGKTVGLAEWIINVTCLVDFFTRPFYPFSISLHSVLCT